MRIKKNPITQVKTKRGHRKLRKKKPIRPAKPKRNPRTKKLPMTSRPVVTRPRESIGPEGFSVADLRAGALRLLMLAASFEHRPLGTRDLTAERQIRRVLNIIGPHLGDNADAEDRARVARLSTNVAAFYELFRHDENFDAEALECAMKNMLEAEGYLATTDALDELVPAEQEIRAADGPQEAADLHLGAVLGVASKSISNWRLGKVPVGTQVAFAAQVGPLSMVRYLLEMLLADAPVPDLELERVKALLLELIQNKHVVVAKALSRLTAMQGRAVAKLEL